MDERKFTDEEIVEALRHCSSGNSCEACKGCPFDKTDICIVQENALSKYALDLVTRQAEVIVNYQNNMKMIDRLNKRVIVMTDELKDDIDREMKRARLEVVDRFAIDIINVIKTTPFKDDSMQVRLVSSICEMACKKCLHYEMCLDNFRKAKEEGLWELTDEEEYFSHADECDFCAVGYRKQSEGEWQIKSEIYQMLDDVDEELFVECPFCQRRFWVPYEFDDKKTFKYAREHYPYCNCGAKMKGGAE